MERTNKCRMDSDVVWRKALAWSVPWNERKKLKTQLLLKWWTTPLYPLKNFKKKKNKERKGVQFWGKAIWGGIGEKVVYSDLVYSKERLCACIQQSVFSWAQHKKKVSNGRSIEFPYVCVATEAPWVRSRLLSRTWTRECVNETERLRKKRLRLILKYSTYGVIT